MPGAIYTQISFSDVRPNPGRAEQTGNGVVVLMDRVCTGSNGVRCNGMLGSEFHGSMLTPRQRTAFDVAPELEKTSTCFSSVVELM